LAKEIGNPQAVFQEQPIGVPLRITATAINPADESQPSAPVTRRAGRGALKTNERS